MACRPGDSCICPVSAGLSWSKTYETLSNAFVYVSDCTALDLKTDHVNHVSHRLPKATAEGKSQSLWQAVLQLWQDYRTWLTRVCSLCTRLTECISAERAAEMMIRGKADTPTLFDMGKAAFRSQVRLSDPLPSASCCDDLCCDTAVTSGDTYTMCSFAELLFAQTSHEHPSSPMCPSHL